ncbi:unnamed protein product [Prunus armeniaca]
MSPPTILLEHLHPQGLSLRQGQARAATIHVNSVSLCICGSTHESSSSSPLGLGLEGGGGGGEPKMAFQQQVLARAVWGPLAWAGPKAGAARAAARRQADVSVTSAGAIFFSFCCHMARSGSSDFRIFIQSNGLEFFKAKNYEKKS